MVVSRNCKNVDAIMLLELITFNKCVIEGIFFFFYIGVSTDIKILSILPLNKLKFSLYLSRAIVFPLVVRIPLWRGVLDTTLCDKVSQ